MSVQGTVDRMNKKTSGQTKVSSSSWFKGHSRNSLEAIKKCHIFHLLEIIIYTHVFVNSTSFFLPALNFIQKQNQHSLMLFSHWAERLNLVYHALFSNLCSRLLRLVDTYLTQKLCSFTNVLLAVFSSLS